MSVSLARPRLGEAFSIAQRRSTPSIHNNFLTIFQHAVDTLFVRSQASLSHLSHGVPITVLVSF